MGWREALARLPFGSVPEIGAQALAAALRGDEPPLLIDLRTEAEWRLSHIPGARLVTLADLRTRPEELGLTPDATIVAICLSAHRSIPAVRVLRATGFDRAVQLRGGMLAWWAKRLPTSD